MTERRPLELPAEIALAAVTLAAVAGMTRLFDGLGWLGPLTINAIAAHAVVAVCRRRGLSVPSSAVVTAACAAAVATWTTHWSTTVAGLPTAGTWTAMREDLSSAWSLYQDVVAPAPVETGFVLASAVALWCLAFVADWAAFRLWVPFEATLPAGTLFLFTALLGVERGRGLAVGLYAAALLAFLLLHRLGRQDASSHWVAERRTEGHRSLLTAGAALGVLAVVTGTVFGPTLPGAGEPGVLDPRSLRGADDARVTISPLVDIRSQLVDQSPVQVFTVHSSVPAYWRLTSLEEFDGRIWTSSGTYSEEQGDLPEALDADVPHDTFEQTFEIEALSSIWLPSAFVPQAIDTGGIGVLFDDDSATLIVDRATTSSDGLTYRVTSASPRLTATDLTTGIGDIPDSISDEYLGLPDDFSPRVRALAQELTADTANPYEAARALQDHLRAFTYDLTVGPGHSADVLEGFLFDSQRGYCEQFAGAFAAMARAVGIPARVAVGFTTGEVDVADPTLFHVRGEHAHAWPEVYLAGAGWVAFEPTPGRGMPFAEDYTGAPVAQAATGDPGSADVAPPTTEATTSPTLPTTPTSSRPLGRDLDTSPGADTDPDTGSPALVRWVLRPLARVAPVVVLVLVAYGVLFPLGLLLRRQRRRRRAATPAERVDLAWTEAVEAAALVGFVERRSDTFSERVEQLTDALHEAALARGATLLTDTRAAVGIDTQAPEELADLRDRARTLAHQVEMAAYSAHGADELTAELAEEAAAAISSSARAAASPARRAQAWLDPRPHVRAWRVARVTRQRRITTTARADLEVERQLVGTSDRR